VEWPAEVKRARIFTFVQLGANGQAGLVPESVARFDPIRADVPTNL
jgi:hypothetical protein